MPLVKETSNDPDPSSEESIFSFPHEQQPLTQDSGGSSTIATTPPHLLTPEHLTLPETQSPIVEEFDESNDEPYLSLDSNSEEDETD